MSPETAVSAAPILSENGYGCCSGIVSPVKTLTSKLYIKHYLASRKTYPQHFHMKMWITLPEQTFPHKYSIPDMEK
jgi:hypothetical protein